MFRRVTLLVLSLAVAGLSQNPPSAELRTRRASPQLVFSAEPEKDEYSPGEKVCFIFRVRNQGEMDVFLARPFLLNYYVHLRIIGPDGRRVPWCGKIDGRTFSVGEFGVVHPGGSLRAVVPVSCDENKDSGYVLDQPGKYVVFAQYHISLPAEVLKRLARNAAVWDGWLDSRPAKFRIAKPD
jgi:hypothetical protein